MTTETPQPQAELGSAPGIGQGQSQGHRRRRRRRKNKTSQVSAPLAQLPQAQPQAQAPTPAPPQAQSAPPPKAAPARQSHQNQGQQGRKKKQFFKKGSGPTAAQPGNSLSAPPQAKRKSSGGGSRQKGPREFVGPMDHSYRVVNGNIADGPASTIQMMSNGHNGGGQYSESSEPQAVVPIREDAPTRIFCFIEDLFFQAKIQETARKLGVKVEFVKGDKESVAKITDLPEEDRPTLVVFDLNNLNAKPMTLIPKLKAKLKKATSIVGFLNHLQGELKMKAMEVGCDSVMPRSAFSQTLPNLLRRYGVEEEEEYAQQPM